jgi:hypothetical protein
MSIAAMSGTIEEFSNYWENWTPTPSPIVTLEDFFQGNNDLGSIGCYLLTHPGLDGFFSVLKQIRDRGDVQDVLVEIYQISDQASWPSSERVYILTSATSEEVIEWMHALQPVEISKGWAYGEPAAAPDLMSGIEVYAAWWD